MSPLEAEGPLCPCGSAEGEQPESVLRRFLAYEQRDPFAQKQDHVENPDYSDWDRCAAATLRRGSGEGRGQSDHGDSASLVTNSSVV